MSVKHGVSALFPTRAAGLQQHSHDGAGMLVQKLPPLKALALFFGPAAAFPRGGRPVPFPVKPWFLPPGDVAALMWELVADGRAVALESRFVWAMGIDFLTRESGPLS